MECSYQNPSASHKFWTVAIGGNEPTKQGGAGLLTAKLLVKLTVVTDSPVGCQTIGNIS